jgi:hypothetical protein
MTDEELGFTNEPPKVPKRIEDPNNPDAPRNVQAN